MTVHRNHRSIGDEFASDARRYAPKRLTYLDSRAVVEQWFDVDTKSYQSFMRTEFIPEIARNRCYGYIALHLWASKMSPKEIVVFFRKRDLYVVAIFDGDNVYEVGMKHDKSRYFFGTAFTNFSENYNDLFESSHGDLRGIKLGFHILRQRIWDIICNIGNCDQWRRSVGIFALMFAEPGRFHWSLDALVIVMRNGIPIKLEGEFLWMALIPKRWRTISEASRIGREPKVWEIVVPRTNGSLDLLDEVRPYAAEALIFRTWHWENYDPRRQGGRPNHDVGPHDGGPGPGDDGGTCGGSRRSGGGGGFRSGGGGGCRSGGGAGAFDLGGTSGLNRSVGTRGPYDVGSGSQGLRSYGNTCFECLSKELCQQLLTESQKCGCEERRVTLVHANDGATILGKMEVDEQNDIGVAEGFKISSRIAVDHLESFADKFDFSATNIEPLVQTCILSSKIVNRCKRSLAEIAVKGVMAVADLERRDVNLNLIKVFDCLPHMDTRSLTSIAQEALQVCEETVKKVRNCVKYVKTSEPIEDYFLGLKQQRNMLNTRNLSLDDRTKWNTTFDPDYFKSPSGEEWKVVDNLCTYLKLIFDTASLLASSSVPTANTFFNEAWKLELDLTRASTSEDNIISTITRPMLEGFDKYWKSCCFVLAIAVVMDPRFKMKLVDFTFAKIFGDKAASYINIVDEGIRGLFQEYATDDVQGHLGNTVGLTEFDAFIKQSSSQQSKSELDQYLEESLLPRYHEFDVMQWWKLNESKYPIQSKMARDTLTLPVSTVDPECIFDTCVKEMDRYQCTLMPEMVVA